MSCTTIEGPMLCCESLERFRMLDSGARSELPRASLSSCLLTSNRHLLPPWQWASKFVSLSDPLQCSELELGYPLQPVQLTHFFGLLLGFFRPRYNDHCLLFPRLAFEESRLSFTARKSSCALVCGVLRSLRASFEPFILFRSFCTDLSARFELTWIESVEKP